MSSDHVPVVCYMHIAKPPCCPVFQIARNLRGINKSQFRTDVSFMICSGPLSAVDDLNSHLDIHAPSTRRGVTRRKSAPWYSSVAPELRALRKERRRAERLWLASGQTVHKQIMNSFRPQITELVTQAKTGFYSSKVAVATACKELFRLTGSLMGKAQVSPLPSVYPPPTPYQLPQVFSDYFCSRAAEIRDAIDKLACCTPSYVVSEKPFFGSVLTCFHAVTEKNVRETKQKMPSTTCELDPIPASLLFECFDEIAPVLTDIVNACLSTGSVPDSLKQAIDKPLRKKPSLDPKIKKHKKLQTCVKLAFCIKTVGKNCSFLTACAPRTQQCVACFSVGVSIEAQHRDSPASCLQRSFD